MEYSKLIYDYLEGELEIAEEQKLFSEMAYNDALREEFTSEVKLSNIFAADSQYQTTPIEATDGVFKQLGFTIPAGSGNALSFGFWKRFSKTALVAVLLLVSFATTAGIVYLNGGFSGNDSKIADNSNLDQKNITTASVDNAQNYESNATVLNAGDLSSFFNNVYNAVSRTVKFSNVNSENKNSKQGIVSNNSENAGNISIGNKGELETNHNVTSNISGSLNFSNMHMYYSGIYSVGNGQDDFVMIPLSSETLNQIFGSDKYSIQTKGAFNNYYPAIENVNINSLNSFEIAFWYNADDRNSVGITVGRNSYSQKFNTEEGLVYYQAPEIFWVGASYKRMLLNEELFGFIMPYSAVMAGASTIGPVLKLESGVEFMMTDNFRIMIGVEGNSLIYNVDGEMYNSNNVGLIYGIKYSF